MALPSNANTVQQFNATQMYQAVGARIQLAAAGDVDGDIEATHILCDTTGGDVTITLQPLYPGKVYIVRIVGGGANNVVWSGTQDVDGVNLVDPTMTGLGSQWTLVYDAELGNWRRFS